MKFILALWLSVVACFAQPPLRNYFTTNAHPSVSGFTNYTPFAYALMQATNYSHWQIIATNWPWFQPPIASFSADVTNGVAPLNVTFSVQETGAVSFAWDFGDGGTSTDKNPTHNYTIGNTNTVTLICQNYFGSVTNIKSNYVVVTNGALPDAGNPPSYGAWYSNVTPPNGNIDVTLPGLSSLSASLKLQYSQDGNTWSDAPWPGSTNPTAVVTSDNWSPGSVLYFQVIQHNTVGDTPSPVAGPTDQCPTFP